MLTALCRSFSSVVSGMILSIGWRCGYSCCIRMYMLIRSLLHGHIWWSSLIFCRIKRFHCFLLLCLSIQLSQQLLAGSLYLRLWHVVVITVAAWQTTRNLTPPHSLCPAGCSCWASCSFEGWLVAHRHGCIGHLVNDLSSILGTICHKVNDTDCTLHPSLGVDASCSCGGVWCDFCWLPTAVQLMSITAYFVFTLIPLLSCWFHTGLVTSFLSSDGMNVASLPQMPFMWWTVLFYSCLLYTSRCV